MSEYTEQEILAKIRGGRLRSYQVNPADIQYSLQPTAQHVQHPVQLTISEPCRVFVIQTCFRLHREQGIEFGVIQGGVSDDAKQFQGLDGVRLQSKPREDGKSRNAAFAAMQ